MPKAAVNARIAGTPKSISVKLATLIKPTNETP